MRLLLLGCNGQLGWELQRSLAPLGEVVALGSGAATADQPMSGNFEDLEGLARTVRAVRADVVVNAAAYTAVDRAEQEPDRAQRINAEAPALLARLAAETGAWLLHYSTDYVFNGSGTRPWQEDDATDPLSVYGRSKRDGEQAVRSTHARHVILRTSWVYGMRGGNFAKTMLRLAAERDALKVVDDQMGAPTGADLLADVSAHIILALQRQPQGAAHMAGTYHCAAAGETSWHGYARWVIEYAWAQGLRLQTQPSAVAAIPTRDYPLPAQRPLNSRLSTDKLRHTFGLHLPHWQVGVRRMLDEVLPSIQATLRQ